MTPLVIMLTVGWLLTALLAAILWSLYVHAVDHLEELQQELTKENSTNRLLRETTR
jgi:hypothetical protein